MFNIVGALQAKPASGDGLNSNSIVTSYPNKGSTVDFFGSTREGGMAEADEEEHMTVTCLPSILPSYLRALMPRSGYKPGLMLPRLSATWKHATIDAASLARYNELCCLQSSDGVPLLYPHALLFPLTMKLMTHPSFPLGVVGAVHVRNHVVQYQPLEARAVFEAHARLGDGRRRPQGYELDLTQELRSGPSLAS